MSSKKQAVSSPIATGGSGTFFEQHVGAQFLALLLVRGIPPILKDCQVEEVHFQTEHLGWQTDDVLVVGNKGGGQYRHLAAQVKRSFTISSENDACQKAFADFWQDFKNSANFSPETDRLALITLQGTNLLLDKFGSLLDFARASVDGSDFERRIKIDGLLSKTARKQAETIQSILEKSFATTINADDFWRFLCVLHVISLDLTTKTAQQEAWTKNLLAFCSSEPDPFAAAESTWSDLLQIVGGSDGMPAAGSYRHNNLPEVLRQRHSALAPRSGGLLRQLLDHSLVTLDGINTTIASHIKVRREILETKILDSLEATQVTLINGPAGYGKSAVAKNVVEQIKENCFCLVFRAEEFASSHIDQSLQAIQDSLTANRLLSLLSAQGRKFILIESVERLLESSERKAFMDLLRLVRQDQNLRLILTCRDYSIDTVKISLLEQVALQYELIDVRPFTDEELDQVAQEIPQIAVAVQNPNLKKLIRSPYFLDIAARINWSEGQLPDNEKEFRDRCWSEIIRSDVDAADGMPRKREQVFLQLSLQRAKELRPYVRCDNFDANVLEALHRDGLVAFSEDSQSLAAPAHDVLEDWATIHWLHGQFVINEGEAAGFAEDIGGYPALRRGYRKWLGEALRLELESADTFILSAFQDDTLPAHFRDDTIICTLLSSSANDFLLRNGAVLLAHDAELLIRVIHLLRVACKTAHDLFPNQRGLTSQLLVPTGTAWSPVLKIVSEELEKLLPEHFGIVLGLVEDWSQQVAYWKPQPEGYKDAGKIIARLLDDLNGYNSRDLRKRALEIFAKIPNSAADTFRNILRRAKSANNHDDVAKDFADLLLTESSGTFACRDFPEEIIDLAMSYFCLTDEDLQRIREHGYRHHWSLNIDSHFGIRQHVAHKFSVPASAIRGPFWALLRSHPRIGVDFITTLINHACSWYGEQKWPFDPLEPAWQVELNIPEESQPISQWANGRLYAIYRGTSVAPYVLQSALMALEHWLLEIAKLEDVNLESWLLKLLQDSNNVAVTAVVASVCIAHPDKCGRAGLALLSTQDIIDLDRSRMVHDQANNFSIEKLMPSLQPMGKAYDHERIESGALPHRKSNLESLAINLQLGDRCEEVWQIIDQHRANLPPLEDQSEGDLVWRLALHRMDVRGFQLGEEVTVNTTPSGSEEDTRRYFSISLGAIEPDVQEIVDSNSEQQAQHTKVLSLWLWGQAAWDRNLDNDSQSWQEMLSLAKLHDSEAQDSREETQNPFDLSQGGSGLLASVCIRDYWDEMNSDDRSWCVDRLIAEVEKHDGSDHHAVLGGSGGGSAAYTLPCAIQKLGVDKSGDVLIAATATALTHSVTEIREYAAAGLGYYLGETEPDFVMRYVGALAKQARLAEELREKQQEMPYEAQLSGYELFQRAALEIRKDIVSGEIDAENELRNLDPLQGYVRFQIRFILQILSYLTTSESAARIYERVAYALTQDWERDNHDQYSNNHRDFEFELWFTKQIARFALKLDAEHAIVIYQPILQSVETHPKEVSEFVEALIYEEDKLERESPFWEIWQNFADHFANAKWNGKLDERYATASSASQLLSKLLLGISWKDKVRYWPRLRDQENRIENLVKSIPATSAAFKAYCRFLYHVGERALPKSFTLVAERLKTGDASQALTDSTTTYYLEVLLRRFVYGEPLQLKSNRSVREAVLYILDQLVETGSSAAYQMRDDFVTPISPSVSV